MKKIGILGSGDVAKNLAIGFADQGYQVMLGTSHPKKLEGWLESNLSVKVGNFNESAEFGELIVLAIKGSASIEILQSIKNELLHGKTILDTTNPIDNSEPINNVLAYFTKQNESLHEKLQNHFPKSNFVKAFNSIGASLMYKPDFKENPTMFICGDNEKAKEFVIPIIENFGFEVENFGKKESARPIESLCILWCIEGLKTNVWNGHGIKLLRKN
ncbi:MAG: NADPH-dependent F420 reductase [Xanthomarina gelatinilytica]|uniref:NADPH-dependent F420 reductase n=1 Tax=Xanthomarina gelatinilytica TaxID=1137281 RepID=UPI003A88A549